MRKLTYSGFPLWLSPCVSVRGPLDLLAVSAGPLLTASAQTVGQGALEGSVLDFTGAVVPRATVSATDQATGVSASAVTSGAGLYSGWTAASFGEFTRFSDDRRFRFSARNTF